MCCLRAHRPWPVGGVSARVHNLIVLVLSPNVADSLDPLFHVLTPSMCFDPLRADAPIPPCRRSTGTLLYDTWQQLRHRSVSVLARIIHQSQKLTEEGVLGSRMILQTAVSQERHHPKTSASGCPGTVPTGRMAIIGHNASSQPPQAYRKLFALTPRRSPRRFPGPARLDARTPTRSNCASIPAPPGTTRVTIS
jgi:hypothetical protein